MADKLTLRNMVFYGYHGAFAAEKELGQKLEVDVELVTDLGRSGQNDDVDLSINCVDLYTIVKEIVEEREFNLPEAAAETIAAHILSAYDVESVTVRVRKPHAPVGGLLDYVEATVERSRQTGNVL